MRQIIPIIFKILGKLSQLRVLPVMSHSTIYDIAIVHHFLVLDELTFVGKHED